MTQIARCDWPPERARWSHLVRSGLPAVSRKKNFPESHIINPLLTKFVQSRWLDIGLVPFSELMDLDFVSVHKHVKKDLASIQPSWPHTWPITRIKQIHDSFPVSMQGLRESWCGSRKHPYPSGYQGWSLKSKGGSLNTQISFKVKYEA